MFGMNQNHEVRIDTLERQMNFIMQDHQTKEANNVILEQRVEQLRDKVKELQHALNNSDKRINQLFDVIGVLMEENKNNLNKFNNIISNLDTAYGIVDQRLSNLGFAVGQHEQEIATLVDFKNALSTTGIVVKVADVAAEVKVKYRVG